jgi:hypothetical protein
MRLQAPNQLYGQKVRPVRFAGVQLNAYVAGHTPIDSGVDIQQAVDADVTCKKHLSSVWRGCVDGGITQSNGIFFHMLHWGATRHLAVQICTLSVRISASA